MVLQRVPGSRPEVHLYDASRNLFKEPQAATARCASCGHEAGDHDVGEDGGCDCREDCNGWVVDGRRCGGRER
jgi:hypothetical protein